MKTARIALLLVMMLVLVACTERQRRTAMSAAANALLASLLDAQSNAPLTQSTFRASKSIPVTEPVDVVEPEPAIEETITPVRCPLAPMPFASTQLSDVARNAAGVLDRIPSRNAAIVAQAIACAQAKAQVISRCRYIRIRDDKVKGTNRLVFRAEITIPGDAIEISGADDRAL